MKNKFLPFQIGDQYEKWEFDLEYLPDEKIQGFDSYFYLWKKTFLNIIPSEIELLFSLDILQVVIMTCEFQTLEQLQQFRQILEGVFGNSRKFENEHLDAEIFEIIGNLNLWLIKTKNSNHIEISYGISKQLYKIYD